MILVFKPSVDTFTAISGLRAVIIAKSPVSKKQSGYCMQNHFLLSKRTSKKSSGGK